MREVRAIACSLGEVSGTLSSNDHYEASFVGKRRLIHLILLLSSSLLFPHLTFGARGRDQSRPLKRLIVLPLSAPHLNRSMIDRQTRTLIKLINKRRTIGAISLKSVKRGITSQGFNLKQLKRPNAVAGEISRLCIRLQSSHALSIQMKLGTDKKPARLTAALFFCKGRAQGIERFELPFEGRLSPRVWRLLIEQLYDALSRPRSRRNHTNSEHTFQRNTAQANFRTTPPSSQSFGLSSMPPSQQPYYEEIDRTQVMRAPMSNHRSTSLPMQPPEPKPLMSAPEATMTESSRLYMSGGARFLTKSYTYNTAVESRVLRGGLRYDSQWLIGWGIDAHLRLFSGESQVLRGLSLRSSFSRFTYDSIRVIRSPFDPPIKVPTPSDLSRWSAGFIYAYPLRTASQAHQVGFGLTYHGELMNLTYNPEYLGLDLHLADLSLFGEFVLSPSTLYLTLEGGVRPFASLGNRVTELGSSAESYGGSSSIGLRYRSSDGLTLAFKFHLALLYSTPIGEGRGGRLGTEAKDQTISLDISLGYSSDPVHQ